ncbi:MAG: hypothetical protein KAH17_08130, partial [Bacteroidales bacterium]|nr:hypothetical protein [Bacteroidales bacterium]
MKQVGLISIILLILLSSFSMDTSSNIPVEDPYFGNGIHNGWADQNSIVIWTRLTKNSEMNYDGKAFIPLTSKQQNQLNKLADHKQIHAAQIPAELSLEDMEGACLGAFGEVKLSYHPEGFPEKRVETSWDNSVGGHKIYPSMALNQPDFFVHTGDTEYYDKFNPWAMTEDLMRFKWDRLFALPFQREFYTNTTSYFIKDDHDLLRNDTYPGDQYGTVSFERGLEIFEKEQFPGNEKPDKTVRWGKEQKDWFFKPIEESDATFKLIISPTPILGPDREKKNDNHANAGFQHCDVDENVVHTETFRKQIQETPISIAEKLLEASQLSNEGFVRCRNYVSGWLEYADSTTGLIPRNIQSSKDIWNAQDAAADNYPFMVLTAAITDRELFEGKMLDMLRMETKLSSRIGALPDDWSFSKQDFVRTEININRIMFGSSEYLKDGLLPLTEWLGESPWSERMLNILDDMWAQAMIETEYGKIVSTNMEVNGEMLQVLSRMFWMTGEQKYLDWAIRIGDYYLLGNQHPTRDFEKLKLRDHGCEIISGLCELYATLNIEDLSKKVSYEAPIHEMIDLVLEKGRNEDGLFYNSINTHTGEVLDQKMSDNFGYNLNGVYTVYLVDGTEAYREAIKKTLSSLNGKYNNFLWEGRGGTGSSDGYADAIEGALNIYNREPVNSAAKWIDSEMQVMWSKQQESGIIEGWHGDGNFARTTIMYCLWKTQGITIDPWREDVKFGALTQNDSLYFSISADSAWTGKIIFDTQRHKTILNMPDDWPRINQFPEWFTVKGDQVYQVKMNEETKLIKGDLMAEGMSIQIEPGKHSIVVAHDSNLKYVDPSIGSVGVILEPTRPTVHLPNSLVRVFPIRKDQLDDQI